MNRLWFDAVDLFVAFSLGVLVAAAVSLAMDGRFVATVPLVFMMVINIVLRLWAWERRLHKDRS